MIFLLCLLVIFLKQSFSNRYHRAASVRFAAQLTETGREVIFNRSFTISTRQICLLLFP